MFKKHRIGDKEYIEMSCLSCKGIITVVAQQSPGFSDYATVVCPGCGADAGEIRADLGYKLQSFKPPK